MKPAYQQSPRSARQKGPGSEPLASDQILDLLLDALEERREERNLRVAPPSERAAPMGSEQAAIRSDATSQSREDSPAPATSAEAGPEQAAVESMWSPPAPQPSVNLGRMLSRLLLAVAVMVVLVNIPVNRHGTPLARIMPDSAALVIRDGLVLKASGPDVFVLQDDKLRWISSLEAFEYFGYQWPQVRVVEESFLQKFEMGRPIHVLLKCSGSPHIYALENSQKRWIKDIETFEVEGYAWEDVKSVDCAYLRGLPDGPPIPEDAGAPPRP